MVFTILVTGTDNSGKTSLIHRFVTGSYSKNHVVNCDSPQRTKIGDMDVQFVDNSNIHFTSIDMIFFVTDNIDFTKSDAYFSMTSKNMICKHPVIYIISKYDVIKRKKKEGCSVINVSNKTCYGLFNELPCAFFKTLGMLGMWKSYIQETTDI